VAEPLREGVGEASALAEGAPPLGEAPGDADGDCVEVPLAEGDGVGGPLADASFGEAVGCCALALAAAAVGEGGALTVLNWEAVARAEALDERLRSEAV
jgi:hypothetical protein